MEHEERFQRIEAALEKITQAQLRGEYALTDAVEQMARSHKQLLTAQVLMSEDMRSLAASQKLADEGIAALAARIAALAEAQTKSEFAQAETQGKLDALIHMWDDWIRGRANGGPKPPAA
ncbi:MAG: hypothetical protein HYX27_18645 [Acidobacteria bacterium]|nr:hypothetical protein [Acidobacteriota bacterium]